MTAWHKMRIDSLCEVTSSKRVLASDYVSEGVPFYRGKEIGEKHYGNVHVSTELFITRAKFDELRSKFGAPKAGDLLLTSIGALLGLPYVVKHGEEFYFKDGNLTWFRNFDGIESQFLYCWMLSPQGKGELQKSKIGSAQPAFTINLLKQMEIELPPAPVQRRIAEILLAYDNLIENNTRRIVILEQMAQMLYREWFVNFRFPGHEKVAFTDSALGAIPSGWTVERLDSLARITMGQSPPSEHYNSAGQGLPFHQGVSDFGARFPVNRTCCTSEGRIAEAGDILMSVRAPVGRLNIARSRIVIGRGLCAIQSKLGLQPLLLQQLKERFLDEDSMGSGTIFKAVTKQDVCGLIFAQPNKSLAIRFVEIVLPMFRQLELLSTENVNLRTTRDLLLPKLVGDAVDRGAGND